MSIHLFAGQYRAAGMGCFMHPQRDIRRIGGDERQGQDGKEWDWLLVFMIFESGSMKFVCALFSGVGPIGFGALRSA